MESWKTFYTNKKSEYQISINGEVKNKSTNNFRKVGLNTAGYKSIKIDRKWFFVHRLVAQSYIANPNNYPNVLHKDNNPLNNSAENLYWGTQSDNIKQCVKDGRHAGFINLKKQNQYTKAKRLGLAKPITHNQYTKKYA